MTIKNKRTGMWVGLALVASIGSAALAQQAPAPAATTAAATPAGTRKFVVKAGGTSRIQFVSDAPLETITGVTSSVSGELSLNPAQANRATGFIEVDTASLRTGVDLRDEHLRGNTWLDSAQFPKARFEIISVQAPKQLRPNAETTLKIRGRFTLHGVTKEVTATGKVKFMPLTEQMRATPGITGDVISARVTFPVYLTDFNISVPAVIRLKVADQIQVTVGLTAIAE